jgi:hypothetical protein
MVKDLLYLVIEAPLERKSPVVKLVCHEKLSRVFESEALSTPVRAKGLLLPYRSGKAPGEITEYVDVRRLAQRLALFFAAS